MFPECGDPDIRWVLNNALKFWRACPTRRCRRARSCVGDDRRCHAIFWPVVPEEAKVFWRAALDALRDNRSAKQAERLAECRRGQVPPAPTHRNKNCSSRNDL